MDFVAIRLSGPLCRYCKSVLARGSVFWQACCTMDASPLVTFVVLLLIGFVAYAALQVTETSSAELFFSKLTLILLPSIPNQKFAVVWILRFFCSPRRRSSASQHCKLHCLSFAPTYLHQSYTNILLCVYLIYGASFMGRIVLPPTNMAYNLILAKQSMAVPPNGKLWTTLGPRKCQSWL